MHPSDHVVQARARKRAEAEAHGIDDAFISRLVESFYIAVSEDEMLGPIFSEKIKDWPAHLGRMKNFWASIMIESGRFSGDPMRKHIALGRLDEAHFARWQAIWEQTLSQIAPNPIAAERFREAAQRIGQSLLLGIQIDSEGVSSLSGKSDG